tara:strand:- start:56 stop:445 length:390 start_codon:yes stop_codon:yes gene_type:complete
MIGSDQESQVGTAEERKKQILEEKTQQKAKAKAAELFDEGSWGSESDNDGEEEDGNGGDEGEEEEGKEGGGGEEEDNSFQPGHILDTMYDIGAIRIPLEVLISFWTIFTSLPNFPNVSGLSSFVYLCIR